MFLSCIVLSGDRPYLIDRLFDGKKITPRPTIGTRCKACRGTTQISALYQNDDNKANTSLADNGAYRVPLTRPYRRFTGQAPKGNARILLHVRSQPYGLSVVQISKHGNFIIATSIIITYIFNFSRGNYKNYQIFYHLSQQYFGKAILLFNQKVAAIASQRRSVSASRQKSLVDIAAREDFDKSSEKPELLPIKRTYLFTIKKNNW